MTWAIGACNQLGGYAALVSDIQVEFRDGCTRDMLRKAYPVGPHIVAAFAGSVVIGFSLLQNLIDHLQPPEDAPENGCWQPNVVAAHWAPIAKKNFELFSETEKKLGAQVLLVGPHPTENGIAGRAIPYICKLSAPSFKPEFRRNGASALGIGRGQNVPYYTEAVADALDVRNGLLEAGEVGRIGGWAQLFAIAINHALQRHPVAGISEHVHFHIAMRGEIHFGNSDRRLLPPEGPPIEIRMPTVAQSYEEFCAMAQHLGADAAGATC